MKKDTSQKFVKRTTITIQPLYAITVWGGNISQPWPEIFISNN